MSTQENEYVDVTIRLKQESYKEIMKLVTFWDRQIEDFTIYAIEMTLDGHKSEGEIPIEAPF
jgi:hypothetical protein